MAFEHCKADPAEEADFLLMLEEDCLIGVSSTSCKTLVVTGKLDGRLYAVIRWLSLTDPTGMYYDLFLNDYGKYEGESYGPYGNGCIGFWENVLERVAQAGWGALSEFER